MWNAAFVMLGVLLVNRYCRRLLYSRFDENSNTAIKMYKSGYLVYARYSIVGELKLAKQSDL